MRPELYTAPLQKTLPEVTFPSLQPISAPSGWQLYVLTDTTVPLVVLQLLLPVGSAHAPQPGLTQLTMRGLLCGTHRLSADEFHRRLERHGAMVSLRVGRDSCALACVCLSSALPEVGELLREMLAEPALADEELQREQQRQYAALLEWCQEPDALAEYALFSALAPEHPYRYLPLGAPSVVATLTAEECRQWYATLLRFRPRLCLVGGAVEVESIVQWLDRLHCCLPAATESVPALPQLPSRWEHTVALIHKPGAVQSAVAMALPAPSLTEEGYAEALLLTMLLGGYFLSRLNRRLREQEGLSYGVGATMAPLRAGALILITGAFDTPQVGRACQIILQEVERLGTEPLEQEELQRGLRVVSGALLRQMVTLEGVLSFYGGFLVQGVSPEFPVQLFARLRTLTPEAVWPVQQRLFRAERVALALSGPIEELRYQVASLGRVVEIAPPCPEA